MGIMVCSLFWAMQDFYHQPYSTKLFPFSRSPHLSGNSTYKEAQSLSLPIPPGCRIQHVEFRLWGSFSVSFEDLRFQGLGFQVATGEPWDAPNCMGSSASGQDGAGQRRRGRSSVDFNLKYCVQVSGLRCWDWREMRCHLIHVECTCVASSCSTLHRTVPFCASPAARAVPPGAREVFGKD